MPEGEAVHVELFKACLEESSRDQAPKKLGAALDERRAVKAKREAPKRRVPKPKKNEPARPAKKR